MEVTGEVVRLDGVVKTYGRQRVLDVPGLVLHAGERVVVTGTNGSGKSTLLRLLGRISTPDRGSVWHAPTIQRGRVGYVPQRGGLYADLSVRENLAVRRRLYGLASIVENDLWYIRELSLEPLLDKRFEDLSGGFQRLATVAAALHVEPRWLLLDEPFYGVDEEKRARLVDGLVALTRDLDLVVVASPFAGEFPHADRSVRIEAGRLLCGA